MAKSKVANPKQAVAQSMSQANLNYYFKKEFGISPKKYQNHVKIERAKDMLYEGSVTQVAMRLGFVNISHFIRLFKAEYGLTPKQYLKSY